MLSAKQEALCLYSQQTFSACIGGKILKQVGPHVYLNVIQIQLFQLSIVVFQLLQASINVGRVRTFLVVHLEVGILGDPLQEYMQWTPVKPYQCLKTYLFLA